MEHGLRMYKVMSDSMYPTICKGQYVFIKDIPFENLALGDIVAIDSGYKTYVHRMINTLKENSSYFTKGDNNLRVDAFVLEKKNYIGKVCYVQRDENVIDITNGNIYQLHVIKQNDEKIYECNIEMQHIWFNDKVCAYSDR